MAETGIGNISVGFATTNNRRVILNDEKALLRPTLLYIYTKIYQRVYRAVIITLIRNVFATKPRYYPRDKYFNDDSLSRKTRTWRFLDGQWNNRRTRKRTRTRQLSRAFYVRFEQPAPFNGDENAAAETKRKTRAKIRRSRRV